MKKILTLTEVVFKGVISKVNFAFIGDLLVKSNCVRFNSPEKLKNCDYSFIISLLKDNGYVDIAFDSFELDFVSNIFVNLVVDNGEVELLFFLDIKNIDREAFKESVDMLIAWAKEFGLDHSFDLVVCQPDNAEPDNFYFKDGKYGSSYGGLT